MRKSIVVSLLIISSLFAGEKYTLEECLDIAQKNNPDMTISKKQQDISGSQLKQAWGNFLPSASASYRAANIERGESDYQFLESNSNDFSLDFNVNQPLFNSSILYGYKLAKNGVHQAGISKTQTRQYLISFVTENFYAVLKAQELLKVYEKAHKNSLEQLKKTEEMHKLGQVTQKDVLKAKVKEGSDRLNIITQKKALETATIMLKSSMGFNPTEKDISVYEETYTPVKEISYEAAKEYCLENNTNLQLLESQKQNAQLQFKMEKLSYLPTASAGLYYNRGGSQFDRVYSEIDKHYSRTLSMSINFSIFEGFKRKNKIQMKQIEYDIYDDRLKKETISLLSDVDELVRTLETYKEMLEINQINLNSAKEDLRLAQEMYKLNSATFLEVLDAQAAYTRAASDIIRIKYEMKVAETQLNLAMGTL
ncbi:MAG: TolC family protein [Fidelibacterota bacterium]